MNRTFTRSHASSTRVAEQREWPDVTFRFAEFSLDPRAYQLTRGDKPVALRPKAFELLVTLVRRAGELVEKDELMTAVWPKLVVEENNITVLMTALRKSLGEGRDGVRHIVTLPGRGYRFITDVQRIPRAAPVATRPIESGSVLSNEVLGILPFHSAKSGPMSYLEYGLADALATQLSRMPNIVVRPPHSALGRATRHEDVTVIGRQMRADVLLMGSILATDTRLRVSVQLVRVEAGAIIWGEQFDETIADLFKLEDRIAERVAMALTRRLTQSEEVRLARRKPLNAEAHEAYLRGRSLWNRRTGDSLDLAIEALHHAIQLDPDYALAHAALADCYNVLSLYSHSMPVECSARAKRHSQMAIALDPMLPAAHTALAYAQANVYEWREARRSFDRALSLDPNHADAHHWYSVYHTATGNLNLAMAHARRALDLDPASVANNENLGHLLYFADQIDEAVSQLVITLELDPHYASAHCFLGLCYLQQGLRKDGVLECERAVTSNPRSAFYQSCLAYALASNGDVDCARAIVAKLNGTEPINYSVADSVAFAHLALGEFDAAFQWLIHALAERAPRAYYLQYLPLLSPVRKDPRYAALLRDFGAAALA